MQLEGVRVLCGFRAPLDFAENFTAGVFYCRSLLDCVWGVVCGKAFEIALDSRNATTSLRRD